MAITTVAEILEGYEAFSYTPGSDRMLVFNLTKCEECGTEAMDVNPSLIHMEAQTIVWLAALLRNDGMIELVEPPDEISWCEQLGYTTCSNCWIPEEIT